MAFPAGGGPTERWFNVISWPVANWAPSTKTRPPDTHGEAALPGTVASLFFQECLLNHCLTHPKTTMGDGKAVWGSVCGNAGAVSDYCDEDRTEPHGKALDLLGCLSSNPH